MGRVVVLLWGTVDNLSDLLISLSGIILKKCRQPQLIYNYMWTSLNTVVLQHDLTEAM